MVYMPLTKLEGFFLAHRVPAGIVVYNGTTGELSIQDKIENTNLPVYPSSVAAAQREAVSSHSGTWLDAVFGRVGYDTSGSRESNFSEFSTSSKDGSTGYYVSALTSRGSATGVIAFSSVASNSNASGVLADMDVFRYESGKSMLSISNVENDVTSTLTQIGIQTQSLSIYEFMPQSDGQWVATVGTEQNIIYRAVVNADKRVTLFNAAGKKIGDSNDADGSTDAGVSGGSKGDDSQGGSKDDSMTSNKDVSKMTNQELNDLAKSISDELTKRASK